jgi:hypothetical protein
MAHQHRHIIEERVVGLPTVHHGSDRGMVKSNNGRPLLEIFLPVEELYVANQIL